MAPCGHDLFNQLLRVRGMEEGLMDLVANPDFAEAFFERLTATIITAQEHFLDEVGDLLDVHFAADDLTGQRGPLISPAIYRRMIKPRWARILQAIKARTKAKIFYHSCGAIGEFLPDLIEIGVDIINPVQVSASGMDTADLKRPVRPASLLLGRRLRYAARAESGRSRRGRQEVRRRIRDLAPGGGFVFNPVHNIQPHIAPANIAAMFQAAQAYGAYRA